VIADEAHSRLAPNNDPDRSHAGSTKAQHTFAISRVTLSFSLSLSLSLWFAVMPARIVLSCGRWSWWM
jgi:hypothetical protein